MKVVIEKKEKTWVLDYLKEAVSLYISGGARRKLSFKLERIIYVLGDLINIEDPKDQEYRYNSNGKRQLIFRAIQRISKYKQISIPNLKKAARWEISHLHKAKTRGFFLVFVWNVPNASLHARSFTINKMRFKVLSFKNVCQTFDFREPIARMNIDQYAKADLLRQAYLVVEIHGTDESSVVRKAYDIEELLRSIFNFELVWHRISVQSGIPQSLSEIKPPRHLFTFDVNKKYLNNWKTPEYSSTISVPSKNQMTAIKALVNKFENLQKCPLKEMLRTSLILYNHALDQSERAYSFLVFWQILEIIGLGESKWQMIEKRIAAIFFNKPLMVNSLKVIRQKRNMFVHQGRYTIISLGDVNQIKAIAEACIDFLFQHIHKLKNKEGLLAFYAAAMLDKNDLKKKITINRHVLKKMP